MSLPPISAADMQVILQPILMLATMGVTEIKVHPDRFPLLVAGLINHVLSEDEISALPTNLSDAVVPLSMLNQQSGLPITVRLVQWKSCDDESCESCAKLAQSSYPQPEEEKPDIWTP